MLYGIFLFCMDGFKSRRLDHEKGSWLLSALFFVVTNIDGI